MNIFRKIALTTAVLILALSTSGAELSERLQNSAEGPETGLFSVEEREGCWWANQEDRHTVYIEYGGDREGLEELNISAQPVEGIGNILKAEISNDRLSKVAEAKNVTWIDCSPGPVDEFNDELRSVVDASIPKTYLDGSGVSVSMWDGGCARNHTDLNDRTVCPNEKDINYHAVHVAGTMLGDGSLNPRYRGVSEASELVSFEYPVYSDGDSYVFDFAELNNETNYSINRYDAVLSQNSWGSTTDDGVYDAVAKHYDSLSRGENLSREMTFVFSAGNSGSGYETINRWGSVSKNAITVGSINSDTEKLSSFSSRGPSADGRIKPEVVAPGCEEDGKITSTYPEDEYSSICGTSMSSPAVSGILGLLNQRYRELNDLNNSQVLDPAVSKAILVETAEDKGRKGPDYKYGFGLVKADEALDLLEYNQSNKVIRTNDIRNESSVNYTVYNPSNSFSATLAWLDPPGDLSDDRKLVNDMDIRLYSPSGDVHYPWNPDPEDPLRNASKGDDSINNLEKVFVSDAEKGRWTVKITSDKMETEKQEIALAVSKNSTLDSNTSDKKIYDSSSVPTNVSTVQNSTNLNATASNQTFELNYTQGYFTGLINGFEEGIQETLFESENSVLTDSFVIDTETPEHSITGRKEVIREGEEAEVNITAEDDKLLDSAKLQIKGPETSKNITEEFTARKSVQTSLSGQLNVSGNYTLTTFVRDRAGNYNTSEKMNLTVLGPDVALEIGYSREKLFDNKNLVYNKSRELDPYLRINLTAIDDRSSIQNVSAYLNTPGNQELVLENESDIYQGYSYEARPSGLKEGLWQLIIEHTRDGDHREVSKTFELANLNKSNLNTSSTVNERVNISTSEPVKLNMTGNSSNYSFDMEKGGERTLKTFQFNNSNSSDFVHQSPWNWSISDNAGYVYFSDNSSAELGVLDSYDSTGLELALYIHRPTALEFDYSTVLDYFDDNGFSFSVDGSERLDVGHNTSSSFQTNLEPGFHVLSWNVDQDANTSYTTEAVVSNLNLSVHSGQISFRPRNRGNYSLDYVYDDRVVDTDFIQTNVDEGPENIFTKWEEPLTVVNTTVLDTKFDVVDPTSVSAQVSNSSWTGNMSYNISENSKEDSITGEMFNETFCNHQTCKPLEISSFYPIDSPGNYSVTINISNPTSTEKVSENITVYDLRNVSYSFSQPAEAEIIQSFEDKIYREPAESVTSTVPDTSFSKLGLNFTGSDYGDMVLVNEPEIGNTTVVDTVRINETELEDKNLYYGRYFEVNTVFDSLSLRISDVNGAENLYTCSKYDLASKNCESGWDNYEDLSSPVYINENLSRDIEAYALGEKACNDCESTDESSESNSDSSSSSESSESEDPGALPSASSGTEPEPPKTSVEVTENQINLINYRNTTFSPDTRFIQDIIFDSEQSKNLTVKFDDSDNESDFLTNKRLLFEDTEERLKINLTVSSEWLNKTDSGPEDIRTLEKGSISYQEGNKYLLTVEGQGEVVIGVDEPACYSEKDVVAHRGDSCRTFENACSIPDSWDRVNSCDSIAQKNEAEDALSKLEKSNKTDEKGAQEAREAYEQGNYSEVIETAQNTGSNEDVEQKISEYIILPFMLAGLAILGFAGFNYYQHRMIKKQVAELSEVVVQSIDRGSVNRAMAADLLKDAHRAIEEGDYDRANDRIELMREKVI